MMEPEAEIVINGIRLSTGEAMTLRVAMGSLSLDLLDDLALGNDETGKSLTQGYRSCLTSITKAMMKERI